MPHLSSKLRVILNLSSKLGDACWFFYKTECKILFLQVNLNLEAGKEETIPTTKNAPGKNGKGKNKRLRNVS